MSTIATLLAATDFSEDARKAVERGAWLAGELQASLTLLHVLSSGALGSLRALLRAPQQAEAALVADAQRALDTLGAEVAARAGSRPRTQVRVGRVADEVLAAAEQADLLVLGARGVNPMRDALLGTTAERLLHRCRKPVLITRQTPQAAYERVLVPVDVAHGATRALGVALQLAPRADLALVHAFGVPFEGKLWLAGVDDAELNRYRVQARQRALAELEESVATAPAAKQWARVVERGDAAALVLATAAERNADLIVIGKHSRPRLDDMVLGSVTRHVLAGARCDVLVVGEAAPESARPDA